MAKYGKNNPRPQSVKNKSHQAYYEKKLGKLEFQVANPGTLSRSASNVVRGKSVGATGRAGYQVAIVRANQQLYNQTITPGQYQKQLASAAATYKAQEKVQSDQRRRTSITSATSEGIKQQEARAVAATKGGAIGTIQKDNTAKVSVQSKEQTTYLFES